MIKGVSNIWMPVQDTDRAVDFYENILGFPVVKRDGAWAEVDANGLIVGLNGREPEGTLSEGGPVLTFQPEGGLEAAVDDLKERGVYFPAEISEHDWGRVATFRIPRATTSNCMSPRRVRGPVLQTGGANEHPRWRRLGI